MIEHPILFPDLPKITISEPLIVLAIASVAYFVVFNNFEKHLPIRRRVIKLAVVVGILTVIGVLGGRYFFWGIIAFMTIGQIILHGWYFPKHGINGWTAEPYDKYLATIQRMKGEKREPEELADGN